MATLIKRDKPGIKSRKVRLIDENGDQIGIVPLSDALDKASDAGLDLVVVAEQANPPVCKIIDYGKLLYEEKQKKKKQKKKQQAQKLKELRFRCGIEEHDYQNKLNQVIKFLEKGYKVKLNLFFRGRELAHKEKGFDIINRCIEDLEEYGKCDKSPALSGRVLSVVISPDNK